MSEYKNIRGKKIKFLTSDLSGEQSEGQLFYSDTDNDFKTVVASAAWSSAGAMITATGFGTHSGPNTNSFYVGGLPVINTTQHYNGTGWSTGGNYPSSRYGLASAGTQTAGLAMAGEDGSDNKTNVSAAYDGSSWTAGPNINSARGQTGGTGTQTSALLAGGRGPGGAAMVTSFEEWNGTAWANLTGLTQARGHHGISGPETAAFIAGGGTGNNAGSPVTALTEEFDGSSLSNGGSLNTARTQLGTSGNSGDGLLFAGSSNEKNTEQYNGTSWTETSDLTATHRACGNGAGSISNSKGALAAGAYPAVGTTEEWNITVNTVTGGAWGAGGNMNTNRGENFMLAGTIGAAVAAGGFNPSVPGATANSEEYNGTSWTEGNNLNTARWDHSAAGTQTACVFGGGNTALTKAEEYNGTSWSEGGDMNTGGRARTSGVLTAAIIAGRKDVPGGNITVNCESYDGSSWTEIANLSTARGANQQVGGPSAALSASGTQDGVGSVVNVGNVESWDGSSWTEVANVLDDSRSGQGSGTVTAMMLINGSGAAANGTQIYNGTSWVSGVSTPYSSVGGGANGASTAVLNAGGSGDVNGSIEFAGETTALNIKTLTDS